jgi:hypothetical protein
VTKEPFWPWDEGYDDVPDDKPTPDSHPDSTCAGVRSDDVAEECWTGQHQSCTGYTEPAWDPDLCNCQCHDDAAEAFMAADR